MRSTAYRAALAGKTPAQILAASFPATRIARTRGRAIRVLVSDNAPQVIVTGQTPLRLVDEGRRARPRTLPAGRRYQVTPVGRGYAVVDLDDPAKASVTLAGPVLVDSGAAATGIHMPEPVDLRFRGALRIRAGAPGRLQVVNVVGVEGYVKGVLPGEMPPAWGRRAPSALVAGAVAVRSRALAAVAAARRSARYDLDTDTPLYLGLDGERGATSAAVDGSRRWVLTRSGQAADISYMGVAPLVFVPDPGRPEFVAASPARPVPGARAGYAQRALDAALSAVGTPYRWGGESPGGYDCSGLVYWAYGQFGFQLPRVAEDQARAGLPVSRADLRPGDAVFFADSSGYIHHMGLYVGGGRFVHAPQTGDVVKVQSLTSGYYARQYAGARRFSP